MVKRALISVSNKEGIVEFGKGLQELGVEILSTGGTAKLLKENGVEVKMVSEHTGHPEILGGRVKTLHPKVHGGILALRDKADHVKQLQDYNIDAIDLVVVNLYPFQETVSKKNVKFADAIENIDIGGPTMIRSAAKNFEHVGVIVDPADYPKVLDELKKKKKLTKESKNQLAVKAFKHTASYDCIIGEYLCGCKTNGVFPELLNLTFEKVQDLRYGENPHQKGAFYKEPFLLETSIVGAKQLFGKELSYNNIFDSDGAFELVKEFKEPTVVVVKHANPCGVASRDTIEEAFEDAYLVDPMSAFGCIIAMNKPCSLKVAQMTKGKFIEVLIAPSYDKKALEFLKANKQHLRILETGPITQCDEGYEMKKVVGGVLAMTREWPDADELKLEVVSKRKPFKEELEDLKFAWRVNKHVKSNSVVFCKDKTAYGIGAGQMSRVDASIIATRKSAGRAEGGVMSSDAFFPFRDSVDEAAKAGVKAVIHPGGSKNDKEVIEAADDHNMAMVFTGVRLFKH
ncbi:MAG: bifunctional phosphoribosylaminoimidazolecarboxamide formyltransferase/IMP cyclohydrolase [Candidatus Woesearchaeota archaeon]|jgi:phosphoribosylaminoimidazolecarboxamide formyltransferase/IMP cyclohydrolase|nr:bifunctional phosphoribosylaminoimidazolecarboxamide formyltransferase/IMP cyclohydrolase [Candidatus Woesearchaeota archaeon]